MNAWDYGSDEMLRELNRDAPANERNSKRDDLYRCGTCGVAVGWTEIYCSNCSGTTQLTDEQTVYDLEALPAGEATGPYDTELGERVPW